MLIYCTTRGLPPRLMARPCGRRVSPLNSTRQGRRESFRQSGRTGTIMQQAVWEIAKLSGASIVSAQQETGARYALRGDKRAKRAKTTQVSAYR